MKKVIKDLDIFRKSLRVRQEVSDEILTIISFIKYELQNSIEIIYLVRKEGKNNFGLMGMDKTFLTMNSMKKSVSKITTTSENMTYLVDNKTILRQHKKLHPLIARRVKYISEQSIRQNTALLFLKGFTHMSKINNMKRVI